MKSLHRLTLAFLAAWIVAGAACVFCGCGRESAERADQPEFKLEVRNSESHGLALVVTDRSEVVFSHRVDDYADSPNIWNGRVTMVDFDQDGSPEFVTNLYWGGNSFCSCYVVGLHKGRWTLWADGIDSGISGPPSFADMDGDGNLDIISAPNRWRTTPWTNLFRRAADGSPTFEREKSPNGDPPAPLAPPTIKTDIRLSRDEIRDVFIADRNVTQFARPHHIHAAEVSPDDRCLMVWHMDYSPRKLSVYDLKAMRKVSAFTPGAGGTLAWAADNLIYHQFGAGTNTAAFAVYSVDGEKQWGDSATGAELCRSGRYVFSFPTTGVAIEEIRVRDVRDGKVLAGVRPAGISCVLDHMWIDGRTIAFRYSGRNNELKVVEITIDSDSPPARTGREKALNTALKCVWRTELARSLRRKHRNTIIYVEGASADGVHVYLGFDEGTHTTRHSSLRVRPDGTLWRQFTRPDLELDWRREL